MFQVVSITGGALTFEQSSRVVFDYAPVRLHLDARARMHQAHDLVQAFAAGEAPVYGVNTGLGKPSDAHVGSEIISQLQLNLIRTQPAPFASLSQRQKHVA